MSAPDFKPGDTVRVLPSYPLDPRLHARTGLVLGYSDRPSYAVVLLDGGGSYFFLDSELELVQ